MENMKRVASIECGSNYNPVTGLSFIKGKSQT